MAPIVRPCRTPANLRSSALQRLLGVLLTAVLTAPLSPDTRELPLAPGCGLYSFRVPQLSILDSVPSIRREAVCSLTAFVAALKLTLKRS